MSISTVQNFNAISFIVSILFFIKYKNVKDNLKEIFSYVTNNYSSVLRKMYFAYSKNYYSWID